MKRLSIITIILFSAGIAAGQTTGPATSVAATTTAQRDATTNDWRLITQEKPPGAPTVGLAGAGAGNTSNGIHRVRVAYSTAAGHSSGGVISATVTVVDKTVNGQIAISAIPTGSVFVTGRKVYMTTAGGSVYRLLSNGTIANNSATTLTANDSDATLLASTLMPTSNTTANPIIGYDGPTGAVSVAGAAAGTVSSVSVVTANGQSGSVGTATTTPAITLNNPTALNATTSLTSPFFQSAAVNPADAGAVRLGNTEVIAWEKFVAGTDWTIGVNASDELESTANVRAPAFIGALTGNASTATNGEVTTNKDATGGYAGLTLFKINFKNAANTFTSFFTNVNSAARTYTFQNRDGTIADDTDLATKQNTITFGANVQTALGVAIGSAGAPVLNGGVLGTPSSGSGVNLTALPNATIISAPQFCADAGASDTYACSLSPVIASYVVGTKLRFFANTANTGAASVNFSSLGALAIKVLQGTADPATGDIKAGAWVDGTIKAGSIFEMTSTLGNAASGGITNSAGANVVPKSDGTNLVASQITDDGTIVTINTTASGKQVVINGADASDNPVSITVGGDPAITIIGSVDMAGDFFVSGTFAAGLYRTSTNCADSAGAAACGSAAAGAVVIDAGSTSVVVSTTAVTSTSRIIPVFDSSLGTELGVTCNTTIALPSIIARTAATSFTLTIAVAPITNRACFTYMIVN